MKDKPKIITFTDLLHKYRNPYDPAVQDFIKENKDDEVFVRRAETLCKLWQMKNKE